MAMWVSSWVSTTCRPRALSRPKLSGAMMGRSGPGTEAGRAGVSLVSGARAQPSSVALPRSGAIPGHVSVARVDPGQPVALRHPDDGAVRSGGECREVIGGLPPADERQLGEIVEEHPHPRRQAGFGGVD